MLSTDNKRALGELVVAVIATAAYAAIVLGGYAAVAISEWLPPAILSAPLWESTLFAGLAGALLGSITGGVISWLLARSASKQTLDRDREQRRAAEVALARVAIIKTQAMLNVLYDCAQSIAATVASANELGASDFTLWAKVQPIIGLEKPHKFEPDELAQLLSIDGDLGNDLMLLQAKVWSNLNAISVYNGRRLELTDRMAASVVGGDVRPTSKLRGSRGWTSIVAKLSIIY